MCFIMQSKLAMHLRVHVGAHSCNSLIAQLVSRYEPSYSAYIFCLIETKLQLISEFLEWPS